MQLDTGSRVPNDMAFYMHVIATATVLGVDAAASPDVVTARLGTEFAENRDGVFMWRDYGTIECCWEQVRAQPGWRGTHISIQVHWLNDDPRRMNDRVQRDYGPFRPRLRFDDLAAEAAASEFALVEIPRPDWDVREFAYRPSGVTILVATTAANTALDDGDVWQISCANRRTAADSGPSTR